MKTTNYNTQAIKTNIYNSINIDFLTDLTNDLNNQEVTRIYSTLNDLINCELNVEHKLIDNANVPLERSIAQIIIGSQKIRFGAYPSKACQESLEDIIQQKIANQEPIPLVIPIGPYKTSICENTDLAEIYALKTLSALNSRVCTFYPQGLKFYLREEDVTGWFLSGTTDETIKSIKRYITNFETLISMLGYENFIIPFKESELASFEDVLSLANIYAIPLRQYILDTNDAEDEDKYADYSSYRILETLGWRGKIPAIQREFYRQRYIRNYPDKTPDEINEMLVAYLSISFAKAKLKALFPQTVSDGFIQLNFVPPVPGISEDLVSRRIYYRVLPTMISKTTHVAFWRAKGFLSLSMPTVGFSMINWHTEQTFIKNEIMLTKNGKSVTISADIYRKDNELSIAQAA